MKYIDVEKLIIEIERLTKSYQDPTWVALKGETAKDSLLRTPDITAPSPKTIQIKWKGFNIAYRWYNYTVPIIIGGGYVGQ